MQLAMFHPDTSVVWADALFVSVLQRSDEPGATQVRTAIAAAVRAYGGGGGDQRGGEEFDDRAPPVRRGPRGGRPVARPAGARAGQRPKTAGASRGRPADTAAGRDMKRVPMPQPPDPRARPRARHPPG